MAIIYSYPKNINILGTDVLIGTSTIIQNGKRKNQTKSFTMLDLSNYVLGNFTPDIPTLQQVSDAGKTVSYPDGVDGMVINIDDQSSNNYYGLNVAATSDANGINASSNNGFGVNAFSTNGTGVYATSTNGFGVYATSISGKAGVFNIQAANTSNIVEFKKNSVNQAYITHNGTIVSNKSLINTTVDNGVDTLQVEGSGFFQNAVTINEGLLKLNNDFSGIYTSLYSGDVAFSITRDNGNGFGIDDINGFVTNTSATATSFIKEGGASSQFLKADGSVDSNIYATDANVVHKTGNETISGTKTFQEPEGASGVVTINGDGVTVANVSPAESVRLTPISIIKQKAVVDYTYSLPDKSGTIALDNDLVGKYVTEASQTGIVFFNNPRANYGNIGVDAVDFSYADVASSIFGATGESSFNTGINTTSSGYNSTTFGFDNTTSAIGGFTTGFNSQNAGYTNFVTGIGHDVTGMNTTVVGQASNVIAESTASFNVATAPVFVVGNGTITDADPDYTVASRSDALIVRKNGVIEAPSQSIAEIDAGTDRTLVTKEWAVARTSDITGTGVNGQVAFWNGTNTQTGSNNLFWDATNNRLRINQATDAGFRLDVNGTARITSTLNTGADAVVNGVNIGRGAGNIATNTRVGVGALNSNTTGNSNTANGLSALQNNTTGNSNTANGGYALFSNTTGNSNTANGFQALVNNTTGYNNTANGVNVLFSNTTGYNNTANGLNALRLNTTGVENTAVGQGAGENNSTGNNNTFIGREAGLINTTGNSNSALGWNALRFNTTGNNNIALGLSAGRFIADGTTANAISNNSVFIGTNTRALADNQTNQIVIGTSAIGLGSNTTVLGNSSTTDTAIYGRLLSGTTTPIASAQVQIDSTTRGFLPPRMTTTQINAISSPAVGLVVYNTTLDVLCYRDSVGWKKVTSTIM